MLGEQLRIDIIVLIDFWEVVQRSQDINTYLTRMNQLEVEFPDVTFMDMNGHLDGTGIFYWTPSPALLDFQSWYYNSSHFLIA